MDKHTLKLIIDFLRTNDGYEGFEQYLDGIDIEPSEAASIIGSIADCVDKTLKFHPVQHEKKSETIYSYDNEDYFSKALRDIQSELKEKFATGSIVTIFTGQSVPAGHRDFIYADEIIESMKEYAYEDFDDFSDTYLDDIDALKIKRLNRLLINWFNKNAKQPTFYNVKNKHPVNIEVGGDLIAIDDDKIPF